MELIKQQFAPGDRVTHPVLHSVAVAEFVSFENRNDRQYAQLKIYNSQGDPELITVHAEGLRHEKEEQGELSVHPPAPANTAESAPPEAVRTDRTPSEPEEPEEEDSPRTRCNQAQSGPRIKLLWNKLNKKERRVLTVLGRANSVTPILDIAKAAFPREEKAIRSSWTRNSLRRLVRARLVLKRVPGKYQVSAEGARQVRAE